jgi:cytochrome c-type protein NapC/trimethylamine-N-oxide reductase cytochrome c-type subunit TorC
MKIPGIVCKHIVPFFTGIIFAVFCFIGINAAMEPTSKSDFCGGKCHEMKAAYRSWELSPHGANKDGVRVECIDCHLPPKDEFFRHITAKAYDGGKDVFKHYFIDGYDIERTRKKVLEHFPNKRCLHCHNSLLTKSGSSAARKAHMEVLNPSDEHEFRCVECHEDVAHQREDKLFSP